MSKTVAVLFSGGLDSTYLMWKNLKDGNNVQPIYCEIVNNENKTLIEKQQIKLILDEFAKEFGKRINVNFVNKFELTGSNVNVNFPQPLIWSLSMAFAVEDNTDEIQVGYVQGDDAILWQKEIRKLYSTTKHFTRHCPKLKFPLLEEKLHKWNLIDELPNQYHNLITSCEDPNLKNIGIRYNYNSYRSFSPCCKCEPCKKIISHDCYGSEIIKRKYERPLYKTKKRDVLSFEERNNLIDVSQLEKESKKLYV